MSLVALVICIFVEEGNTFLPAFATLIALYALRMRYSTLYIGETYIYWHNRYIAIESITEWAVTTTTNKKGEAMTHITLYRGDKKYLFKLLDEGYEPGIEKLIALFK